MPTFSHTQNRKPWNKAARRAYELTQQWCASTPAEITSLAHFAMALRLQLSTERPEWQKQLSIEVGANRLWLNRPNSTEGAALSVKYEKDTAQDQTQV